MTRKQRRLILIGSSLVVLAVAVALVLTAMTNSITYFATPSDLVTKGGALGQRVRLGGLVEAGSVTRPNATNVSFKVTDTSKSVLVRYSGIIPDLFREGQGVVAEGTLGADGVFTADTLLARHDESYMPKEVADALKAQGRWKEGAGNGKVQ